ncbi:MAG TPA: nitrite/sulfite reductase [Blastocatellia bacterium]|nr:nitrite/sulfite reductase [Blastocatellia bacterium]
MSAVAEELIELDLSNLSPEARAEIQYFKEEIEKLESGERDPDAFKRFRLENGVYGIRNNPDLHMVRTKNRFGRITPEQLETLAEIGDHYTPNRLAHITTRQDIQFHYVGRHDLPEVLAKINLCGLTTREACGNTVRNVTACPYAGVSPTELFDVTPYADAVSSYFLRNPINQNLPRKFKFAFEGCPEDHARTPIHDIGAVAAVRETNGIPERGFKLYIAGGLGAQPRSAELLEEFTPADLLIPTCEATIRVFDRHGERRPEKVHRMRARMKFVAREWGIEKLRKAILSEREFVVATRSGRSDYHIDPVEEQAPEIHVPSRLPVLSSHSFEYRQWSQTNVLKQKQFGSFTVIVRCPMGDITTDGMRAVARIARRWCGGRMRCTITQNIALRWVPEAALPWVYEDLAEAGLAHPDANRIADVTRCPGADTCQIALTHSRGLAEAVADILAARFSDVPEVFDISVKISGCMNSCGQHHIADIGFYGASSEVDGSPVPQYVILLGGRTSIGLAEFGKPVARTPARRAPEALERVLEVYLEERNEGESFRDCLDRVGLRVFKEALLSLSGMAPYDIDPALYRDLGKENEVFSAEVGAGECAS